MSFRSVNSSNAASIFATCVSAEHQKLPQYKPPCDKVSLWLTRIDDEEVPPVILAYVSYTCEQEACDRILCNACLSD